MALTCRIVFCFKGGYICVPGCLSVVHQSGFSGDPCHNALRDQGSSMEGNLESTYIQWRRALWHLDLFAIWELKSIFYDPSVHNAHEVGYLPLFDFVAPEHQCFKSPSAFQCKGVVRIRPLQWPAMCQLHRQHRNKYTTYIKVLQWSLGLHNNVASVVVFNFRKL